MMPMMTFSPFASSQRPSLGSLRPRNAGVDEVSSASFSSAATDRTPRDN